jgi:hypothetical protein
MNNTDLAALQELVAAGELYRINERQLTGAGLYNMAQKPARALVDALPALSRLLEAQEGWKLVPVEPTKEMIEAGDDSRLYAEEDGPDWRNTDSTYRAMLAATPPPPSEGEPK